MKIVKISPRGYCKGVVNAINIAKNARKTYPDENIYILGMIVHNKYVSQALGCLNITTLESKNKSRLELLDEIDNGVVIFTAHGVDHRVKEKALAKNLICIDASCVDVIKTQQNIANKLDEGYFVIYVGKANHPEALACVSDHANVALISDINDFYQLALIEKPIYVTNQTTMSLMEVQNIFDQILLKYPQALIEEEICNATRMRQQAIMSVEPLDLIYVVGDPLSNNSNKLRELGLKYNTKKVLLIEDATQINADDLVNISSIGITSGASTPTYLTNQVIEALEFYNKNQFLPSVEIDISKIL